MSSAAGDLIWGLRSQQKVSGGRKGLWSSVKADWRSYPEHSGCRDGDIEAISVGETVPQVPESEELTWGRKRKFPTKW